MRGNKNNLTLSKENSEDISTLLQGYIYDNFDTEISNLQANIFTDFISDHIGKYYYNQGIIDSIATMKDKVDDLYLILKDE